ncbi:unnamed protein product [Fusarium graminearum]|nr:unnamed protein product [Fusarium graminearum]
MSETGIVGIASRLVIAIKGLVKGVIFYCCCREDRSTIDIEGLSNGTKRKKETIESQASSSVALVRIGTESTQTKDIAAPPVTFVALIPKERIMFSTDLMYLGQKDSKEAIHVNPKMIISVGKQRFEINVKDKDWPIKTHINDSNSPDHYSVELRGVQNLTSSTNELSTRQALFRIFYHPNINPSVEKKLTEFGDITMTKLQMTRLWMDEIEDHIKAYDDDVL